MDRLIVIGIVRKIVKMMRARAKKMKSQKMSEIKDIFEQMPQAPQIPTMVMKGNTRDQGTGEVATIMKLQQMMRFNKTIWD